MIVGFVLARTGVLWDHLVSLGSGCWIHPLGTWVSLPSSEGVRFIRSRWRASWRSLVSSGDVGYTRVGSLSSLACAQGVVGFIQSRLVLFTRALGVIRGRCIHSRRL